jgi:hypothetical protein
MTRQTLKVRYEQGKQVITLSVIIVSLLGFGLDALTYHTLYSASQIVLQTATGIVIASALFVYWSDSSNRYPLAFGLVSYAVIINILLTTVIIHTFTAFENFTEANILSRDLFFIFLFIAISGFILGRKHIFIKGILLVSLLLNFIFVKKVVFFIQNAGIYMVISVGFLFVLHFLVRMLEDLIIGLEESNVLTQRLQQGETNKKMALLRYQSALLALVKDTSLFRGDVNSVFRKICQLVSTELPTSRVSIWGLEENNTRLVRKYLRDSIAESKEEIILERKDFPTYFQAVEESSFILALNACEHPATSEFKEAYLKPLSIVSMLDCPIVMDGKPIGVICCENQYTPVQWGTEEVLFIQSMAENISICYKNLEINYLIEQVRVRNIELVEKTNEIETMNEELLAVNETLEETVKKRTSELETQNRQLTEYAFINSHVLRAPLARILGLSYLITTEASIKDRQLLEALIASSKELDLIILKISDLLYDGNNLSRQDIQVIIDRNIYKDKVKGVQ